MHDVSIATSDAANPSAELLPSEFFNALYRGTTIGKLSLWDKASKLSVHGEASDPDVDNLCGETDLYFGVALRRDGLTENQRGTVAECVALPGFFLDIDIQDGTGAHAAPNLPTRAQADELIALYPEPTMIVDSGHGLHVHVRIGRTIRLSRRALARVMGDVSWGTIEPRRSRQHPSAR